MNSAASNSSGAISGGLVAFLKKLN